MNSSNGLNGQEVLALKAIEMQTREEKSKATQDEESNYSLQWKGK